MKNIFLASIMLFQLASNAQSNCMPTSGCNVELIGPGAANCFNNYQPADCAPLGQLHNYKLLVFCAPPSAPSCTFNIKGVHCPNSNFSKNDLTGEFALSFSNKNTCCPSGLATVQYTLSGCNWGNIGKTIKLCCPSEGNGGGCVPSIKLVKSGISNCIEIFYPKGCPKKCYCIEIRFEDGTVIVNSISLLGGVMTKLCYDKSIKSIKDVKFYLTECPSSCVQSEPAGESNVTYIESADQVYSLNQNLVSLSPNPIIDYHPLQVEVNTIATRFVLSDASGFEISSGLNIESGQNKYDVSYLPNGRYYFQVHTAEGIISKQFVIQRP